MSERDAYFAGLFDGEGCIYICERPYDRLQIYVKMNMTCEMTVRAFADYAAPGTGCFTNDKPGKKGHKPQFRIKIQGPTAVSALRMMLPYLLTKKETALTAIQRYEGQAPLKRRVRGPGVRLL